MDEILDKADGWTGNNEVKVCSQEEMAKQNGILDVS